MAVMNPHLPQVANAFFVVSVSVATTASAIAAGVGPFRGLFFKASSSVTLVGLTGESLVLDNVAKNATIWIQGTYVSAISTATAVYALV